MNKIMLAFAAVLLIGGLFIGGNAFAGHNQPCAGVNCGQVEVKAHVPNICECAAGTVLDFGDIEYDGYVQTAYTDIKLTCTTGTKYRVGLDKGGQPLSDANGGRRQMKGVNQAIPSLVPYKLWYTSFKIDDQLWGLKKVGAMGDVTADPRGQIHPHSGAITGTSGEQLMRLTGEIGPYAFATLPKADAYKDTVNVIVYF